MFQSIKALKAKKTGTLINLGFLSFFMVFLYKETAGVEPPSLQNAVTSIFIRVFDYC